MELTWTPESVQFHEFINKTWHIWWNYMPDRKWLSNTNNAFSGNKNLFWNCTTFSKLEELAPLKYWLVLSHMLAIQWLKEFKSEWLAIYDCTAKQDPPLYNFYTWLNIDTLILHWNCKLNYVVFDMKCKWDVFYLKEIKFNKWKLCV